jgi:hypothetical protein
VSIQLQIEERPGYLTAKFIGAGAAEETWGQFESIVEHCKRANKNKLLLDVTQARAEIYLADRYFFGDEAEIFMYNKLIKVAVVVRPEILDSRRFGERVMRNRWVNAFVFTNVEDAEEWLLKE